MIKSTSKRKLTGYNMDFEKPGSRYGRDTYVLYLFNL